MHKPSTTHCGRLDIMLHMRASTNFEQQVQSHQQIESSQNDFRLLMCKVRMLTYVVEACYETAHTPGADRTAACAGLLQGHFVMDCDLLMPHVMLPHQAAAWFPLLVLPFCLWSYPGTESHHRVHSYLLMHVTVCAASCM